MVSALSFCRPVGNVIGLPQWRVTVCVGLLLASVLPLGRGEACVPCPPVCSCQETPLGSGHCQVDCGQRELQSYPDPSSLPHPLSSITQLIIKENSIQELPSALSDLNNLVSLDASNNYISTIPEYLFYNLTNLEELNLLGNRLSSLPLYLFAGLSKLKVLILTRNELVHLQKGVFDDLTSLQVLSINVMPLSTIEDGIFSNANLQKLYMNKNSLTELPPNIFKGLKKLRVLDISVNSLTSLSSGSFDDLDSIQIIYLEHNPWSCTCQMYWLTSWLVDKKREGLRLQYEADTTCHYPEFYATRTLTSLRQNELNCHLESDFTDNPADLLKDLLFRHHDEEVNLHPRSKRSVRSVFIKQAFQSNWISLCRTVGRRISKCRGPQIFSSCGVSQSTGDSQLVLFTKATYKATKSDCIQSCFNSALEFGNFLSKICFCGSPSDISCSDSCQPVPVDYSLFCGKVYLPQTFGVTADLSLLPLDVLSTGTPSRFSVTTSFTVDHYEWNFGVGDELNHTTTTGSVDFSYFYPGDYLLTVSAVSGRGLQTASVYVKVRDDVPQAQSNCQTSVDVSQSANLSVVLQTGYDLKLSWLRLDESGSQVRDLSCDPQWVSHRGRCLLEGVVRSNYSEAAADCSSRGGELLTLDFQEEIGEVFQLLHTTGSAPVGYLIGAQRTEGSGVAYEWTSSGTPAPVVNQVRDPALGDCVTISNQGLTAVNCDTLTHYICQKDPMECSHGGQLGPDGYCYVVSKAPAPWGDALRDCALYPSGVLGIVKTDTAHRFVSYTLLKTANVQEAWIGLSDRSHEGYFSWVDHVGEDSDDEATADEDDDDDEDDSVGADKWSSSHVGIELSSQKDCVMLQWEGSAYTWLEAGCSENKRYLCRYSNGGQNVSVSSYAAGTAVFSGQLLSPHKLAPVTGPSSTTQTTVYIFPGLWISEDGVLNSWDLITEEVTSAVSVTLLVLRPFCPGGVHLVNPGCSTPASPFARCLLTSSHTCNHPQTCPSASQFCYLSASCVESGQPCSCASLPPNTSGCGSAVTAAEFYRDAPQYSVVGAVDVTISVGGRSRHQVVDQTIRAEQGDILGYQHNSANWAGVFCETDTSSKWRQTMLHWQATDWAVAGGTLSVPSTLSKVDDMVCYLRAKFSPPVTSYVPESLSYFSSPGVYRYSIEITGDVQDKTVSCQVRAEERVRGLTLISPRIVAPGVSPGSVGTVPIEWRVTTDIVVRVSQGSHLLAVWDHASQSSGFQFAASCPSALRNVLPDCLSNTSSAAKPFSSIKLNLSPSSPITSLTVSVRNGISSDTLTMDLSKAFRIRGLRVRLIPSQKHVWSSEGDIIVPKGEKVHFRATLIQGSSVKYRWSVNGVLRFTSSQTNKFNFLFTTEGQQVARVDASNVLGKNTNQLSVTVVQPAKFRDAHFSLIEDVIKHGAQRGVIVEVGVKVGANVTVVIDLGDGVSQTEAVVTNSTSLVQPFNLQYSRTGTYEIKVTFSDTFQSVVAVKNVTVINVISGITVSANKDVLLVSSSAEFLLAVSGHDIGDIQHSWEFGDGTTMNSSGTNALVRHKFSLTGTFVVSVTVSNGVGSVLGSVNITVEEQITGLSLSYDGPKSSQSEVHFAVGMLTGSAVSLSINTGDGTVYNRTGLTFTHLFSNSGVYNVTVSAWNKVSTASTALVVYAVGGDMLEVVSIETPDCTSLGTNVTLTAVVINTVPLTLYYTWQFGDQRTAQAEDTETTTHLYDNPGIFTVQVVVNNTVKTKSASAEVCVEEMITAVSLSSLGPLALRHSSTVQGTITSTIGSGSNVTYTWETKTHPSGGQAGVLCYQCEENFYTFTFDQPGEYAISLTASNNISSETAEARVRVQEVIDSVSLSCTNCMDLIYLEANSPTTQVELSASKVHGSHVEYSWSVGSGSPVISVDSHHTFVLSGIRAYTVLVVVSNDVSSVNDSLTILLQEAVANLNINVSSTDVVVGQSMTFQVKFSAGSDLTFTWSLCSGCTNTTTQTQAYTHQFSHSGIYDITLVAKNGISEAFATLQVFCMEVISNVVIDSNMTGLFVPTGELVEFSAAVKEQVKLNLTWEIELDNSTILTESGENIKYQFPVTGIYTVRVIATNPISSGHAQLILTAQEKIHNFEMVTASSKVPVNEQVNVTTRKAAGNSIIYEWKFVNASGEWILPSSTDFIVVLFSFPGAQHITCEASNDVSRATDTLEIMVEVPVSGVLIDGLNYRVVKSGDQAMFRASVADGSHLQYMWYLNGSTAQLSQTSDLTHVFQTPGTFDVIVRVHNDISDMSAHMTIIVQDSVKDLDILTDFQVVRTSQSVQFNATLSSGSDLTFLWTFGDGGISLVTTDQSVTRAYSSPGVFTVQLTASNNVSSETKQLVLSVQEAIERLHMTNCCGAIFPALVPQNFTAAVTKGTDVTFRVSIRGTRGKLICTSNVERISCGFPKSGVYTLKVSASNDVSHDSRVYTIRVQSVLENVVVQPDGPGWQYLFQNQPVMFRVRGRGVDHAHSFEWQVSGSVIITSQPRLRHVFTQQGAFTLTVKVTNGISSASFTKTAVVHKFMCEMPVVEVVGGSTRVSSSSKNVELQAAIDSRNCSYYTAVHRWLVFKGPCSGGALSVAIQLPSSVYVKGPLLRLPKQVLPSGEYCVQFSSGYNQTVVTQDIRYNLTLHPSPFVAVIQGGSDVVLSAGQPVVLDASLSYDPDVQGGQAAQMEYTWNCSAVSLQTGSVQPGCFPELTGKHVQLDGVLWVPDNIYTVTLAVSVINCVPGSDCRTAYAQQNIEISPDPVPSVSVDCLSCRAVNSYQLSPSQHIALRGRCADCHRALQVQYSWTVEHGDNSQSGTREYLVLDSSTTTTGANASDLVIRRGILKDSHSYTFKLEVTKNVGPASLKGEASLVLAPNHPPTGGTCTVYPHQPHIIPLESKVTVDCSGWTDAHTDDSNILYHISLERQLPSGETEQCVLYHGTKMNQSLYVVNWPDSVGSDPVTLRVDIEDDQGAATHALSRNIWLLSPVLKPNESLSEHIATLALDHLRWLVRLHRPIALLHYSIAVLMELNRAAMLAKKSSADDTDRDRRAEVREAIATVLNHIPIESIQDIQQLAYGLEQVSMYEKEVQVGNSHSAINLLMKRLLGRVQTDVKQGLDSADFAPRHLLLAVSNLVRAVNLHRPSPTRSQSPSINLQEFQLSQADGETFPRYRQYDNNDDERTALVTDAVGFTETIMSTVLKTQLQSEQSSVLHMGNIHLIGQRTVPGRIWQRRGVAGCQFLLPQTLLASLPEGEEIFQIMFVMPDNPFTWGYQQHFNITSQVPSLCFQYSNGSEIPVSHLPADDQIQVLMYGQGSAIEDSVTWGMDMNDDHSLQMTNLTLKAGKSKKVVLDTSSAGDNSRSALHVQVGFSPWLDTDLLLVNRSLGVVAYLGVDFEASEQRYVDKKTLTEDMMDDGQDHPSYTFFVGTSSFHPKSSYSLTVVNLDSDVDVVVSVGLYLSSCQYYNPVTRHWEGEGCAVMDTSTPQLTGCVCNHLTAFGASALVPLNAINFADLAMLDLEENPVALITCCILLASYLLLAIICRRQDLRDIKRISKVPLCGTDGAFKYEVTVVTGRQLGAGTTAHVGIKLYGEDGKSGSRHLSKEGAFQRNCQDTFLVAHDTSLGKLWKVLIWHDNAGLSAAWYLIQVVVRDLQTDHRYLFLADCWLSLQLNNGFIQKEIIVTGPHQQCKFSRLYWSAMTRGFSDQHLWVSVVDRPAQSRFSRTQRLTCCFTLLFTYLAVNIMWYGVIKTTPSPGGRGGWSYLSWEEIVVGTVSSLLVFPINILIAYIFRKTRCKENVFEYGQKPGTAETIEMDADCGLSHQGSSVRRVSLRRELTQFYDRESTGDSLQQTSVKPLRRTNTFPKLPSEDSQESLFTRPAADSDSGVSSARLKGQSSSTDDKAWWSHDSIINHWPVMPEFMIGAEFTKHTPQLAKGAGLDKSLRISGIQVGDGDSDDGWSSCLDDLDTAEVAKDTSQKTTEAKSADVKANGDDWSLRDKEEWEKIEAEIFSDELPKKERPPHRQTDLTEQTTPQGVEAQPSGQIHPVTSGFTPRAEASITTTTAFRRRSFSGSVGEITQPEQRKCSMNSQPESSFDCASVEANILFGRERDKTSSSIRTRRGTLRDRKLSAASRLSYRLTRILLPRWCVYVAYGLCFLITALSILLILLYANQLGSEGTWRWIVSLVMTFLLSAFFTEPLKVVFLAVFVAAVTKRIDEVEDDDAIEIRPMIETNERLKDVRFRPLGGYALLQAKEDAKKISRMHLLLRQFVAYFCLLWIVVVISHVSYNNDVYQFSEHLRQEYAGTTQNGNITFNNIDSIPAFWEWTSDVLAPIIHHTDPRPNVILGPARLKQTRSVLTTCPAHKKLPKSVLSSPWWQQCDGVPSFTEDTRSYEEGWTEEGNNTTDGWSGYPNVTALLDSTAWSYVTAEHLQEAGVTGQMSWYSGGGYTQTLGTSRNETGQTLTYLQDTGWLNLRSRAVFVEWTVWNPYLDLTAVVLLTVEFPVTGKALPSIEVGSYKLMRVSAHYVEPVLVCQVILLIVSVYFVVQCFLTVKTHGWGTFTSQTYLMEIVTTLLMLSSGSLYVICVIMTATTSSQHLSGTTDFTSFRKTASLHWWRRQSNAWLGFLLLLKIVKQLRFSRSMSVFGKALSAACWKILATFVLFALLLCIYAHFGYLLFGSSVFGYHSYQACLVSVVGVVRGSVEYEPLLTRQPVLAHLYLYSLGASVWGLVFCLVLTVLRDTYKITHSQMSYKLTLDIHDYEMIDFMLKRFKLWAGITKPKAAFKKVKFAGLPSLSSRSTFSDPSSHSLSHSSSSSDYCGLERQDSTLSAGHGSGGHLDQLPARWEDVMMKMRQLEEMDRHEDNISRQICTVVTDFCPARKEDSLSTPADKPPKGQRARSMSDTKGLRLFSRRGSKSGRKSASPPTSGQAKSLTQRPHSDQGARVTSATDNSEHRPSLISRFFKKAW